MYDPRTGTKVGTDGRRVGTGQRGIKGKKNGTSVIA